MDYESLVKRTGFHHLLIEEFSDLCLLLPLKLKIIHSLLLASHHPSCCRYFLPKVAYIRKLSSDNHR